MTLKINETSKMVIEIGSSYSLYFKATEDNLIIFRGLAAMISQNIYTQNTLESLPWSNYQADLKYEKPSVENYLSEPSKIIENLIKIVSNPLIVIPLKKFEKIVNYYNHNSRKYEDFLDMDKKDIQYSSVVYKWISIFIKILHV